jgi:hypothetical protein
MKKTQRQEESCSQCTLRITNAMPGGAITAPTAVPALMMPMAVERSLTGNHSVTARVAAGKPPPSPMPSNSRLAASMMTFVARPWLAHASDQKIMITVKPWRVPRTSMSLPPPRYISPYVTRKAESRNAFIWLEMGMSSRIAPMATGSVWRSR